MRFNGEWLGRIDFADVVRLTRTATVARLLERDDFASRYGARQPISVSELLYPLMQGFDSVAIEADVELGGTDQLYNLLAGRDVMEAYGLEPQVAMTTPILVGTDGKERRSKSRGNYIGVTDPPEEQFGRTMSDPRRALDDWWRLVVTRSRRRSSRWRRSSRSRAGSSRRSTGTTAARAAEAHFTRVVRRHETPDDMPEFEVERGRLPARMLKRASASRRARRRTIAQGGVQARGRAVARSTWRAAGLDGALLQAGKRRFARVLLGPAGA